MLRNMDPIQDLKIMILDLKKALARAKDENQLLKVKIRKLQSECSKRDRQIETLLDPRKSSLVKKVVSDKGATMIINLSEQNNKLEKLLIDKDILIRRLQYDLQTKKAYTFKTTDKKKPTPVQSKCTMSIPYYDEDGYFGKNNNTTATERGRSASMLDINRTASNASQTQPLSPRPFLTRRSVSADRTHFDKIIDNYQNGLTNNDLKAQYEGLSRDHLLSIIESLKNQQKFSPRIRKGGSPESDLERNELLCDTPHQEIQQLQNYFMDMLTEVDQLKVTISKMKIDQDKTKSVLKQKDSSITKLAKEIKGLKRPKTEVKNYLSRSRQSSVSRSRSGMHVKQVKLERARPETLVAVRPGTVAPEKEAEANGKDALNTFIYKEIDSEEEEFNSQLIQTRTISIQTPREPTKNHLQEQIPWSNKHLYQGESSLINAEEARRAKFSNLLQQIEHSMRGKKIKNDEDKAFNTI